MRVLCCSNMFPSEREPDYGAFVATMCAALERRGAKVDLAVIDTRRSGAFATPAKYVGLLVRTVRAARRADVIYAHYVFPTGLIAAIAGRLARRPWVVTAHGRDVRNLAHPLIRRASAPGLRGAGAVIAVSEHLATTLRESGMVSGPVDVAHMGVDLSRFRPTSKTDARERLGVPADAELVIAVGGLTTRKNPLALMSAVAVLRERRPRLRLSLVGGGPLAEQIVAEAARLGIDHVTHLPGVVTNTQVADWMAACDVLCMPSLVEPLGVVALEALASGRPVVATRVGGAAEVVPAAGAGRIVDPTDIPGIAAALADILDDLPAPEACRSVGEAHGVDLQAARVEAILRRAIDGRRAAAG